MPEQASKREREFSCVFGEGKGRHLPRDIDISAGIGNGRQSFSLTGHWIKSRPAVSDLKWLVFGGGTCEMWVTVAVQCGYLIISNTAGNFDSRTQD